MLDEPPATGATEARYAVDRDEDGYVWNATRLWCWRPDLYQAFDDLRSSLMEATALSERELALVVVATVSELGDSYCSYGWATRLASLTDDETAAQVLADGPAAALSDREAALVFWARQVVRDPNATTPADVDRLRVVGLGDREIFEATALIGFRLAVSTVNAALGAAPDPQLAEATPEMVRAAVVYGRPPAPTVA